MVSELENDIIETMGDWFFRQPIRGLINIETDVTCPLCHGCKNVDAVYKNKAYMVTCPQCYGSGAVIENKLQKYRTRMKYIDITFNPSECKFNQFDTITTLKSSDDILQIKNNLQQDLHNMWMNKWYHHHVYYIRSEEIISSCDVCQNTNYLEVMIRGKLYEVRCPECLHRNRTVKYNINGDMLRSARFTIDITGIKENLGYWGENCGQITPYFTYDDAVNARDKMMKKERL